MSTLVVTTVQSPGGTVPTETLRRGSSKAWVNFNGTGTVAIRDSFNTSSITDGGIGIYTENFTAAMATANFAVSGHATAPIVSPNGVFSGGDADTKTTSGVLIRTGSTSPSNTHQDSAQISMVVMS